MASSSNSTAAADAAEPCPICYLVPKSHPIKLPCSHEFCFLCAKGAVVRNLKCPMCRSDVPDNFFDCSNLSAENTSIATFEGSYHWYYEGRNGWWLFDARVSEEIEEAFQNECEQCEIMIAGFIYILDFTSMVQYRRDTPARVRKIKRDQAESKTKGIAGLRGNINFV